jgi:hypothetical protein
MPDSMRNKENRIPIPEIFKDIIDIGGNAKAIDP